MENQAIANNSCLETFENDAINGSREDTSLAFFSLPPFGNISQSHQQDESRRDVLMPIQQNIIGSSTNFTQMQSTANGSISPLSKSSNSLISSASSSVFSTSSEDGTTRPSRGKDISIEKGGYSILFHSLLDIIFVLF